MSGGQWLIRCVRLGMLAVTWCAGSRLAEAQRPPRPAPPAAVPGIDRPLADRADLGVRVEGQPDWLAVHAGDVWTTAPDIKPAGAVLRIAAATGKVIATIPVPSTCGPITAALDAVWVHTCGTPRTIVRIDPAANRVAHTLPLGMADSEGAFAFAGGAIWLTTDTTSVLTRADPATGRVLATTRLAPDSYSVIAGGGALWVVSTGDQSTPAPTLHKLQLISGRVLYAVALDSSFGPARFADIAVTPRSSVLVLDAAGRRVFVAPPKARRLELAMELRVTNPSSLAPESESVVYIAHQNGILRADLAAGKSVPLTAPKTVSLAGLARLRWHRGALFGVQTSGDGTYRIVQLKLDASGHRITGVEVLDRSLRMTDPTAAALAGDVLYYLAAPSTNDSGVRSETVVRRVTAK